MTSLTFAAETASKFPMWVSIYREGEVIHTQEIHSPEAYIPPTPPGCAVLIVCNDGTRTLHPPK